MPNVAYVHMKAKLQNVIQLPLTLIKLCHIKSYNLVNFYRAMLSIRGT